VSKSTNTRRTIGLLFVFAACVALVCADLVVSSASSQPQNANSSTTTQDDEPTRGGQMTSNSNNGNTGNMATPRRRSRRRARRPTNANANMSGDMGNMNMSGDTSGQDANANMSGDMSNMNMSGDTTGNMNTGRRRRRGRRNRAANANMSGDTTNMNMSGDMSGQDANANMSTSGTGVMSTSDNTGTQADLSGTYTGTVNYPEGGMNGPATLTITGNQFTMTPDGGGSPVSGRVTAVTTRGYTGVTMMFGDTTPPPVTQAPPPLPAVSLRARMSGGRVTLMSVPGEKREFSFSSGGTSTMRRGRRTRRSRSRNTSEAPMDDTRGVDSGIKPPTAQPTPTP